MTPLPYRPDPLPLLAALRPLGRAVLLHSADPNHPFGGCDILVAAPRVVVETRDGRTVVERDGRRRTHQGDPFDLLDEVLAEEAPAAAPPPRTPFAGGLVGLAGYDLARRAHAIGGRHPRTGAFPDLVAGFHDWALVTDHRARRTALHVLPGRSAPPDLRARLEALRPVAPAPLPRLRPEMSRAAYGKAFRRVREWIRAGDCYQINLALPFSAPCTVDPLSLYATLTALQPAPYAGFLETPDGAVLSCSPERLLHCADGVLHTSPIKGTRPRSPEAAEDAAARAALLESAKDRAENLMIVDLLRNDLGRSCRPGSVEVPHLFEVQSFAAVHHLVSTVRGELAADTTPLTALGRAFPGGSVTGAPKLRAMQIIEALEVRRRGPYCGSLFRVDPWGRMDASITIRTLLCAGGRLECWGGGGLVADSEEEAEWREIHAKVGTLIGAPAAGPQRSAKAAS